MRELMKISSRFWLLGLIVAFGSVILVGILFVPRSEPAEGMRSAALNAPDVTTPESNCRETSLVNAVAKYPFKIMRPDHRLANDLNLRAVWDCGIDVALEYESGIDIYAGPNTIENPKAEWEETAALFPEFSVGTVRGLPASLADPAKSPNGTALGGVLFVDSEVLFEVGGTGNIPVTELVEVAESLR